MKRINLLFMVSLVLFIVSCNKKGCTNENADNFNSEAKEDDGSCTYNSLSSIVGKRWFRETDSVVYSFELDASGNWLTHEGCESNIEGTWRIDNENAILYHTFNGQEEEYEIIEPKASSVKFKGGKNATQQIAAENVLLVYNDNYIPTTDLFAKNSYLTVKFSKVVNNIFSPFPILDDYGNTVNITFTDENGLQIDFSNVSESNPYHIFNESNDELISICASHMKFYPYPYTSVLENIILEGSIKSKIFYSDFSYVANSASNINTSSSGGLIVYKVSNIYTENNKKYFTISPCVRCVNTYNQVSFLKICTIEYEIIG